MAEQPSKRQREEAKVEEYDDSKRNKSYSHILSILEDQEEDEPNQDLSDIFKTLQKELYNHDFNSSETTTHQQITASTTLNSKCSATQSSRHAKSEEEEDEKERVIRHLLEASDDELGIPNPADGGCDDVINGGEQMSVLRDGCFWEFEDEAANYYTWLQSELFM